MEDGGGGAIGLVVSLVWLGIMVLILGGFWSMFTKAGEPGWAVLIPIYNAYVYLKIAGKPWWWMLLMMIPLVGFIVAIVVAIEAAQRFGKSAAFGIGMAFLPFIFIPIIGFGDARYVGSKG